MQGVLEIPDDLVGVHEALTRRLEQVAERFDEQLRSELVPVRQLVEHVERYRGKMLRPALVLLCGMAAGEPDLSGGATPANGRTEASDRRLDDSHITLAAVCEMVHMATLVHDDVLDEADVRRRGRTINSLRGNEAAVILGDYLIAAAFHLCSGLDDQGPALAIGWTSMTLCAGELMQLANRGNVSLDEQTYYEILERKTASLIAVACEFGAKRSGASDAEAARFAEFGRHVGVAFQVQDDLLDLTGDEATVGKSVGKDIEKGKLTLPIIHYLRHAPSTDRARLADALGRAFAASEAAAGAEAGVQPKADAELEPDESFARDIASALRSAGSIEHARGEAERRVRLAIDAISPVSDSPAKRYLLHMARAVTDRAF